MARRVWWCVFALLVPAAFVVLSVAVTRWSFRTWPTGAYTWVPAMLALAGFAVLLLVGHRLGSRGVPVVVTVVVWFLGRLLGALAAAPLADGAVDASLLADASFGFMTLEDGRPVFGSPAVFSAALQVAVLVLAHRWGIRGSADSDADAKKSH